MNLSGGGIGSSHTLRGSSPSHQYFPVKRIHSTSSSLSLSIMDLRELTNTVQELNNNFKQNIKILTEIKDNIIKICEKQNTRPVEDNSGVHKLDRINMRIISV